MLIELVFFVQSLMESQNIVQLAEKLSKSAFSTLLNQLLRLIYLSVFILNQIVMQNEWFDFYALRKSGF